MDVQFSDYLTVSCAKKPVAELSTLERWRRDATDKGSRTYKNKSAEETRLEGISKVQRHVARSGGTAKEISSRIAKAAEAHETENVLDVGCWVGAEAEFEFKSAAQEMVDNKNPEEALRVGLINLEQLVHSTDGKRVCLFTCSSTGAPFGSSNAAKRRLEKSGNL